jgi:hypothetical protein
MSWFLRGVQSAIFHYASCAPCTGYNDSRRRRRDARLARKAREKLVLEQPDCYHHPEPTGTNPYWDEEIRMGPVPAPRRGKRTNTSNSRGIARTGTQRTLASQDRSSIDAADHMRMSDDTLDNDTWNLKRYQREDEDLWGLHDMPLAIQPTRSASSAGGHAHSARRPTTSRSGSNYSGRAPPVNDLHPPVVSLMSQEVADNRWMLQPPPKARVMAGKERASNRSRSGSGASSRIELSLQRQVSTRQMKQKLERGQTPELPSISPHSSYSNLVSGQRQDRCRTPSSVRSPSTNNSPHRKRRVDTAMAGTEMAASGNSSGHSSDTITPGSTTPYTAPISDSKAIRVRHSRPALSTVFSSNSGTDEPTYTMAGDNNSPKRPDAIHHRHSSQSSDHLPRMRKHRAPLSTSDMSSLNRLQDTVSPRALLSSRFVSAPLVEAKIRLPPSDKNEATALDSKQAWIDSGFSISREWETDQTQTNEPVRVPFDSFGASGRDPKLRWSVDF